MAGLSARYYNGGRSGYKLEGGRDWELSIEQAIQECSHLLAVLTPRLERNQLRRELAEELWRLLPCRREAMLKFLAWEDLFSPPAVPAPVLAAIARHIVEISREWRWG